MATAELYIFGAGGHGREVGWAAREVFPHSRLTYVVDDAHVPEGPVNGIRVVAFSRLEPDADAGFVTAVGDAALRRAAVARLMARGLTPVALVHPRAMIVPTTRVAPGAFVAAGSVLTDAVEVGEHAIVNVGCTVSHDVRIGAYATLSPGVHLAGNVIVEDGAFLGTGANVINGTGGAPLVIGRGAVVGAGATVIGDVEAGTTVVGVPARVLPAGGRG